MELMKNMVYAGVGLASATTDKVKETINELVEKGRISDTEGKNILEDFFTTTDKRKEELESKFKSASDKISEKFEFLNKEKEIQELNDKINALEIALAKAKVEVKKNVSKTGTVNKKTLTKKTTSRKKETVKK
jgi:polyhydroxyalkanoate synthesis regulator phasin